ncbi:hypothetical protein CSB37_02785 [bacterium DOLZORAL124_38_8]|nr:MAG: hypothetical protein CSB37_02785 [bacterium DOLZORAL124_38_8]
MTKFEGHPYINPNYNQLGFIKEYVHPNMAPQIDEAVKELGAREPEEAFKYLMQVICELVDNGIFKGRYFCDEVYPSTPASEYKNAQSSNTFAEELLRQWARGTKVSEELQNEHLDVVEDNQKFFTDRVTGGVLLKCEIQNIAERILELMGK